MIQVTEETREGWCVVGVRGRADAESADELIAAFLQKGVERRVLDSGKVDVLVDEKLKVLLGGRLEGHCGGLSSARTLASEAPSCGEDTSMFVGSLANSRISNRATPRPKKPLM